MNSSDLGSAMALSGAKEEGARDAVKRVATAADEAATEAAKAAAGMADPHDRTAAMNIAATFYRFAAILRGL